MAEFKATVALEALKGFNTISMDGKGRRLDTVVIARFWRSIKYGDIYLNSYKNAWELEAGIDAYIMRYNLNRPLQALKEATHQEVYYVEK